MSNGHEDRTWTLEQAQRSHSMDHETLYKQLVEYCCGFLLSSLVNTQLMFPLDILTVRFTCNVTIGHWSSGCYNRNDNTSMVMNSKWRHHKLVPRFQHGSSRFRYDGVQAWSLTRLEWEGPYWSLLSDVVHTRVEVCKMDLWNDLGFSLCAAPSVFHVVTTSDDGEKSGMGVSAEWCVAIEHQRSSSIRGYLYRLSDQQITM